MNKQTAAFLSIFSNASLVVLKFVAGLSMGSAAVLSEAIHSAIDLVASFVAWASIRIARQPADEDHPYGHEKFENIAGFFEAILIFVAAALIIYEAVKKLLHPTEVERLGWGIAVMGISMVVNLVVSAVLMRIAKREHSIALEADAMHLSVDVLTSLGVLVGLVLIHFTGLAWLDPLFALGVAALILKTSWDLSRRALDDLADRALPEGELVQIRAVLQGFPLVRSFHKLRSRQSGGRREVDIHVQVDKHLPIGEAHDLCDAIEAGIRDKFPHTSVLIHLEPDRKG